MLMLIVIGTMCKYVDTEWMITCIQNQRWNKYNASVVLGIWKPGRCVSNL